MGLEKDRFFALEFQLLTNFTKRQKHAGIAQLVERNLAKVEVASSNLVSRSSLKKGSPASLFCRLHQRDLRVGESGAIAKRLCNGLQIRLVRFDSGSRLQDSREGSAQEPSSHLGLAAQVPCMGPDGETGRRSGLKIRRP